MNNQSNWLVHDHQQYDDMLGECELVAGTGDWKSAIALFNKFVNELKLHMRMEDEVLYPLVEEGCGDPEGEIAELKDEHDDIVRLIRDLMIIIKNKNYDHFEESLMPMHKALNQHNSHEEACFLSSGTEQTLMRRDEIMARLNNLEESQQQRKRWFF
jgi:hemerythrin-like domain-containing protein